MLDQNTDRMWYVIGAVIIGAAIILLLNRTFPTLFASIGGTFQDKTEEVGTTIEGLSPNGTAVSPIGNETPESVDLYKEWAAKYIKPFGEQAFVNSSDDAASLTATSEGLGYGMVMTATQPASAENQQTFDKLYQYYLSNRGNGTQLMAWQQTYSPDGTKTSDDPNNATDGDIFIAEALIQASITYPKNKELYIKQANLILSDMLTYNYNEKAQIMTVATWATDNTKEWTVFRSADVVPAYFADFARVSGDARWTQVSNKMMGYMLDVSKGNKSGLVSDFIEVKSGKGVAVDYNVMWDNEASYYGWSAIRVPLMVGMGSMNSQSRQLLGNITTFLNKEDPLYAIYYLDGSPAANYSSVATLETLNYANFKLGTVDKLEYKLPNGGYYADTIYALTRVIN